MAANLSITAADVKLVQAGSGEHQHTAPAIETIAAGQYIRYDGTTGKFALGNATNAGEVGEGYFALNSAIAGEKVTGLKAPCVVDVGSALSALSFGDKVYVSDTDGTFADTAGTVSTVAGFVFPGWASTTARKLLALKL